MAKKTFTFSDENTTISTEVEVGDAISDREARLTAENQVCRAAFQMVTQETPIAPVVLPPPEVTLGL